MTGFSFQHPPKFVSRPLLSLICTGARIQRFLSPFTMSEIRWFTCWKSSWALLMWKKHHCWIKIHLTQGLLWGRALRKWRKFVPSWLKIRGVRCKISLKEGNHFGVSSENLALPVAGSCKIKKSSHSDVGLWGYSSETELRLFFLQYCDLPPLITVKDRQNLSS